MRSLVAIVFCACGARSGLLVDPPADAGVDASDAADTGVIVDAGLDASMPDAFVPDAFVPDGFVGQCPDSPRARTRSTTVPVDVIWTIDSSGSMHDDAMRMADNVSVFWEAISDADLDIRVIFITADGFAPPPPSTFPGQYYGIDYPVNSWDGLLAFSDAFSFYRRYLRPDAITHLISVTDDESEAIRWEDFQASMTELLGHDFTFHAIASERLPSTRQNPTGACFTDTGGAWAPGDEYYALADATGGLKLSICNEDWSELWGELNEVIVLPIPLPCSYRIPPPSPGTLLNPDRFRMVHELPSGQVRIIDRVPGMAGCGNGWWLNEASERLELCPAVCDEVAELGGSISIDLDCILTD